MKYFFYSFGLIIALAAASSALAADTWCYARNTYIGDWGYGASKDAACSALSTYHKPSVGNILSISNPGDASYPCIVEYDSDLDGAADGSGPDANTSSGCDVCPAGAPYLSDYTGPTWVMNPCSATPSCAEDEIYNEQTLECESICNPDEIYIEGTNCAPIQDQGTDCQNVIGQFNGNDICGDEQDKCLASGGTFGMVGTGEDMQHVCLPPDYGDDLPTCKPGEFHYVDPIAGGSGFACQSPDDDEPGEPNYPEDDPDGDGLPNDQDPDDDNDGIPDGSDTDANGNGVPDVDSDNDGTPDYADPDDDNDGVLDELDDDQDGDQAGDCDPTEKDYAECIGQLDQVQSDYSNRIIERENADSYQRLDQWQQSVADSLGDDPGIVGPTGLEADLAGVFQVGACSDISFQVQGQTFTISCTKLQILRDVLAWVLSIVTLIAVFNIATGRTAEARA
jgi:hypothetical protein